MNSNMCTDLPAPPESWVKLQESAYEPNSIPQDTGHPCASATELSAGANEPAAPVMSGIPASPLADEVPGMPAVLPAGASSSPVSEQDKEGAEMWLGKNAASAIAATLVFIGLAYLGSAFLPQFPSEVRIVIMFAVSGILTALGSMLELRKGNGLTLALISCGMASLLVSALNLRSLFGLVSEAICFAVIFALLAVRVFMGGGQQVSGDAIQDSRYRTSVIVFATVVAVYECTCGFPVFPDELGSFGAAALGAGYLAILVGVGVVLLRFSKTSSAGIVVFAVACTMLLMSYLFFCTPLAGEGYAWSICCMACALVCAAIGFKMRIGGLRLYGLILTLTCVVKLVVVDSMHLGSPERALAYIVGGLICFAISALYNYAVKRLAV